MSSRMSSEGWPCTWRKAKKPYVCQHCSGVIPKGARYYRAEVPFCNESCYGQYDWQTLSREARDKKRVKASSMYDPANTLRGGRAVRLALNFHSVFIFRRCSNRYTI